VDSTTIELIISVSQISYEYRDTYRVWSGGKTAGFDVEDTLFGKKIN
jgi:hypothetical protein